MYVPSGIDAAAGIWTDAVYPCITTGTMGPGATDVAITWMDRGITPSIDEISSAGAVTVNVCVSIVRAGVRVIV